MKQFLYLDVDKVNSIIAQNDKGLIGGIVFFRRYYRISQEI